MKALKEKRIGVRSLLRRGLIILSLFALVFAVACGGDEGSSTDPGPGPGTDPVPTAKTVTDIVVLSQPSNVSFQGLPPDLTGLVAMVSWSDGTTETVSDPTKFVGIPAYCDTAGTGTVTAGPPAVNPTAPDTGHAIAYVGHTEKTAGIIIPWVVPLIAVADDDAATGVIGLQLTGSAKKVWYSDEIPNFSGLKLEGMYADYADADGNLKTLQKKEIPITASYPFVCGLDAFNADTNPLLSLGVGYKNTSNKDFDDTTEYARVVSFNIEKFVKASGIEVDMATSTFADYFDDDLKLWDETKGPAGYKLLTDLAENNTINLIVSYFDGTQRTIPFSEYLSNLSFYNSRRLAAEQVKEIYGSDGIQGYNATRTTAADLANTGSEKFELAEILKYSEDIETGLPYFNVVMNYVPSIWGSDARATTGTDAWLDQFDVPIPLYGFQIVEATRIEGSGTSNVRVVAEADATPIPVTDPFTWVDTVAADDEKADNLMQALTAKWELTGTYDRDGVQKTKKIALTPQMFADGAVAAPQSTPGVSTTATFILNKMATGYDWTTTTGLANGAVGRGYVLPIWYRGERLNDPEFGGVVVDLVGPQ